MGDTGAGDGGAGDGGAGDGGAGDGGAGDVVELTFGGEVWEWRGPAPFHFVTVPADLCDEVRDAAGIVSYGWGMVPVSLTIGGTRWTTSLWPKDGGYVVPLKDSVRRAEEIRLGDVVTVEMAIALDG